MTLPRLRLVTSVAQNPIVDRNDKAIFLGACQELARSEEATHGMLPAQQRLRADNLAGPECDLRLVMQDELFLRDRFAQFGVEDQGFTSPQVHVRSVESENLSAIVFCSIHC